MHHPRFPWRLWSLYDNRIPTIAVKTLIPAWSKQNYNMKTAVRNLDCVTVNSPSEEMLCSRASLQGRTAVKSIHDCTSSKVGHRSYSMVEEISHLPNKSDWGGFNSRGWTIHYVFNMHFGIRGRKGALLTFLPFTLQSGGRRSTASHLVCGLCGKHFCFLLYFFSFSVI